MVDNCVSGHQARTRDRGDGSADSRSNGCGQRSSTRGAHQQLLLVQSTPMDSFSYTFHPISGKYFQSHPNINSLN